MDSDYQFAFLVLGLAAVAWGLGGGRWRAPRLPRGEVIAVAGVTLLALVLRVWALGDAVRLFVDELNFTVAIQGFWQADDVELLAPITHVVAFPRLYTYWQAQVVALAGRDLAGLRLTSAVLGTLTIPALYGLARTLFDRRTALIAALLLAVFPPHIHFSRLALNNVADPLVGTLALACIARGLRSGQRMDFALGGVCLGLTQYFYEGGRLIFPALVVLWLESGALLWRRRPGWQQAGTALLAAVLAAAPVYYVLWARGLPFTARVNDTRLNAEYWRDVLVSSPGDTLFQAHLMHIKETFLVYVNRPESSFFYAGNTPLVLVTLVPALLLGVFAALGRGRAPGMLLPVGWVALTSLGNSFLVANMHAPRYVVAFPALALLCALGVRCTLGLVWPDGARPRARRVLLALLLSTLAALNVAYYFDGHVPLFNRQLRAIKPYPDGEDAIFRALDFPPGTELHLISDPAFNAAYARAMLNFLGRSDLAVETLTPDDVTPSYLAGLDRTDDHAFFVERGDTATLATLRQHVALGPPQYTTNATIPPDRELVLYYAPRLEPGAIIPPGAP